ncbi:hypothetical protein LTR53_011603 [Teratosphaeriaceae sp. CCFEE 6253]|nr:hypothetical protein LTR53_011603 [Teratosphaeriaceae sp. CCFEE 6253]
MPLSMADGAMALYTLPNEILTHIFTALPTLDSVLALSATCSHLRRLYHGSQRLTILAAVVDRQYGPLHDMVQICTYNASQPAHLPRSVPLSDALLAQLLPIGRCAQQWEELYPLKKWKNDYASRRLLTPPERRRLRRALYRLWHFTRAFHNRNHPRHARRLPAALAARTALLQHLPTRALAEMLDVHHILRDVLANNVCPSNGKVRQKLQKRYPEHPPGRSAGFAIHLNYPPPSTNWCDTADWLNTSALISSAKYTHHARLQQTSRYHDASLEGWGDDINHYYVVEDMLKLDPRQILFLRDHCPLKSQVELFIRAQVEGDGHGGTWFGNNGETFAETLWGVVRQRGGDVEAFKCAVQVGDMGIAVVHGGRPFGW